MKANAKENKGSVTGTGSDEASGTSKKAKKVTYEKQLDDINNELRSKPSGTNGASGKVVKKQKLKPEQEVVLLEQKCILLLKLKRHKEVVDDGYSIIGRLGPNVVVYKSILIALVRLGKPEEDIIELLDAWKKATPKCPQMLETKRKFDGYLVALRSGMKHTDIFSGIEDTLSLNADSVLSKQFSSSMEVVESKWKFRAPPPRHTTFSMCPRASSVSSCMYGEECLFAHSQDELKEWKLRVDTNPDKKINIFAEEMSEDSANRTGKKRPIPNIYRTLLIPPLCIHYLLDLGKKIKETLDIQKVLVDEIPAVKIKIGTPLTYQKRIDGVGPVQCSWSFLVGSKMPMGTVSILHDSNRELFSVTNALYYNKKKESISLIELHPNNQVQTKLQVLNTFIQPSLFLRFNSGWPDTCYYKVDVVFESLDPFPEPGLYRQSIVFDFKKDPKVVKHISIEVLPKMEPIGNHIDANPIKSPWATLPPVLVDASESEFGKRLDGEQEHFPRAIPLKETFHNEKLCDFRELPQKAVGFKSMSVVDSDSGQSVPLNSVTSGPYDSDASKDDNLFLEEISLTKENYHAWWCDFLDAEQTAWNKAVKQIKTLVDVTLFQNYCPSADCTYKYSCTGELYGKIGMLSDVSLDPKLENLIVNHCTSVLIYSSTDNVTVSFRKTTPRFVCKVVEKSKSAIFIAIGKIAVDELLLVPESMRQLHVQFVLDSFAVDKWKCGVNCLANYHMKLLFPSFESSKLPFLKVLSSATLLNEEELFLNNRQQSVYNIITGRRDPDADLFIPPLLLTGGVSTGKSYVLANSLRGLLRYAPTAPASRVLICTRSDAAADVFITEYLHKWLVNDQLSVQRSKPLRIYDTDRFIDSVGGAVKHYCLFNSDGTNFRYPTKEEVLSHRVIIVTLSSCSSLMRLGLENDIFSHIFIDEADQSLEVETVNAILLAGKLTRLVVAGDVGVTQSQIFTPPTGISPLSLLERLRNLYPFRHPFVVNLIENYSNHEVILKFISEEFYHDQLRPASNQPCHPRYYPIGFHHVSSTKELQAENGGGYYNMGEIRCIVDFIDDLLRSWPETWGNPKDKDSLIVVTPYISHITGLRVQLQLKGLQWVNVDLASNLISKRCRVVIISTVRTHKFSRESSSDVSADMNRGFYSNKWLINLTLSSAKSLVIAFGDLFGLLKHGECRDLWIKFARECQSHNSLLGVSAQDGLQLEDYGIRYQSPTLQETPKLGESSSSTHAAPLSGLGVQSSAQTRSVLSISDDISPRPLMTNRAAVFPLNCTTPPKMGNGQHESPWNNTTFAKAPKTDLFSAFSLDVKPLYSSASSPLLEIQSEGKTSIGSQDKPLGPTTSATVSRPNLAQGLLVSRLEVAHQGMSNDTNGNAMQQSPLPLKTSSSPLSTMMDRLSGPFELSSFRQDSNSLNKFAESSQPFHENSVKKLSDINFIESQQMQMPLPVPTIPSQMLFDTKLVVGPGTERGLSTLQSYEGSNEPVGIGGSPCLSPQKFASPLMRAPPGFSQIPNESKVGAFSSPENKMSYHFSPNRGYFSTGKPTFKRNNYELPPRMLKNLHLTASYKSPTRKKISTRPPQATEMNFFEELGLDSQQGNCRSASSASSDQSFFDPEETISIVEDDNSSLSPQSDWIEVRSSRKGKNQHEKKKPRERRAQSGEDAEENSDMQLEMCVDDKVDIITQMGFTKSEAVKALVACEKDLQRAVDWLISRPPKTSS